MTTDVLVSRAADAGALLFLLLLPLVVPVPLSAGLERVALVIGNVDYTALEPLRNPGKDTDAVVARLGGG